jgi:hypothetical protein
MDGHVSVLLPMWSTIDVAATGGAVVVRFLAVAGEGRFETVCLPIASGWNEWKLVTE